MLSKESERNLNVILGLVATAGNFVESKSPGDEALCEIIDFINALKNAEMERRLKVRSKRSNVSIEKSYELELN